MDEDFTQFYMNNGLRVVYLNIRSLWNKTEHLEALLREEYYSNADETVHIITETWLCDFEIGNVNIPIYQGIFRCRNNGRGGEGVAIYLKDHPKYTQIKETTDFGQTEVLMIQITTADGPMKITAL